jgi:hypothetical protein
VTTHNKIDKIAIFIRLQLENEKCRSVVSTTVGLEFWILIKSS